MKNNLFLFLSMLLLATFFHADPLFAQYQIGSWTFNSGSGSMDNANYAITSQVGESIVGIADNDQFTIRSGSQYTIGKNTVITSIGDGNKNKKEIPDRFSLEQNYPNPFNPSTSINFDLPRSEHVQITVYNSIGKKVTSLLNKQMNAGAHSVTFNGNGLTSGIYIYRIEAGKYTESRKMLLVK